MVIYLTKDLSSHNSSSLAAALRLLCFIALTFSTYFTHFCAVCYILINAVPLVSFLFVLCIFVSPHV